jgi:hypothetical protein
MMAARLKAGFLQSILLPTPMRSQITVRIVALSIAFS